jgi:hypothetical protein
MASMIVKGPPQWEPFNIDSEQTFEQLGPTDAGWRRGRECIALP